MNKHLIQGLVSGGIFAAVITWVAASDATTEGGVCFVSFGNFRFGCRPLYRRSDCSQFCVARHRGKGKERSHCSPAGRGTCRGLSQRRPDQGRLYLGWMSAADELVGQIRRVSWLCYETRSFQLTAAVDSTSSRLFSPA